MMIEVLRKENIPECLEYAYESYLVSHPWMADSTTEESFTKAT